MRRRFPRALVPGDTVGLIAPASPIFEPERRDAAAALLRDMGFRVLRGESVDAVDHCFSGTDELRARDVNAMFAETYHPIMRQCTRSGCTFLCTGCI